MNDQALGVIAEKLSFEGRHSFALSWMAETGAVEHYVSTGWPAGTEVDMVGFHGGLSASGGGAATWRVHASSITGWTPLDVEDEAYTSSATLVANPIGDSIPTAPAMFTLDSAGKVYFRIVPNAGNVTGSAKVRLVRRATI